jgi:GDP-D-mannose dehydratase
MNVFIGWRKVESLIGDSAKARRVLDWHPCYTFAELVRLMVLNDLESVTQGVSGTIAVTRESVSID